MGFVVALVLLVAGWLAVGPWVLAVLLVAVLVAIAMIAMSLFILGSFLSLDLVLFFTFFELTLFPMFFMIAGWGGEKRRASACRGSIAL